MQQPACTYPILPCPALWLMLQASIVYRAMQTEIRHLQGVSPDVEELAAEAIEEVVEDAEEGAPLLGPSRS